jgi:thiol:disulfide interchange protein DsbD
VQKPTPTTLHGDKVYLDSPQFIFTLENREKTTQDMVDVIVHMAYQGCSEDGLCYEPTTKDFTLRVAPNQLQPTSKLQPLQKLQPVQPLQQPKKLVTEKKSQTDTIADTMKNSNLLVVLATFFVFGVLLSLTPCVFPMIPIISGLIISQGKGLTTKKAFFLSLVYVFAMAVAYTIAGVVAGLFGANLQATLQNPVVVYSFALIFVLLAFSMFGFYELKLPDSLVNRVSAKSNRGGVMGVAVMGFLSALIVGPCVAAPLAGALVYIGQTGDALLGGSALFVMSLGMGLPLIVVGVSAGKFMPRPGGWMTLVNATFGVMMLVVAIWMLEKVVAFDVIVLLYALLGLGFSIYLGVFEQQIHFIKRFISLVIFLYSLALFIGFLAGASSLVHPLNFLHSPNTQLQRGSNTQPLAFKVIHSQKELDAILANTQGKKVMVDFSAAWCTACKELDEKTLSNPQVKQALQNYILVRVDVTANTQEEKAVSKKYGVFGPPVILFFDEEGRLQKEKTIVGFVESDIFLKFLLF